jgi:hypothetical protein
MEISKIKAAAEIAKSRTTDKRWLAAIDKAVAGVESGWWIVTELAHGIAVTTECGKTYFANGACQCKAFENGQACKHRALARLVEIAGEIEAAEEAARRCEVIIADIKSIAADVAASPRANLIAEIENIWPRACPGVPLYTELLSRYGKSHLSMLDDDSLRRVRLAIAM